MKKGFCFLLCLLLFCFASAAQDAAQQQSTLAELSSEIHTTLDSLKRQSEDLTLQLAIAKAELEISSKQAGTLRTELDGLNSSLRSTSAKLSEYSKTLSEYEAKLKRRAKIIAAAGILLALFLAVRVILAILTVKFGIKIPYWLNLIL